MYLFLKKTYCLPETRALLRKHMRKISEENIKPYFSWSSWKSSFFKQKTLVFCKEQVFVKNHLSVFFSEVLGKLASGRLPPDPKTNPNLKPSTGGNLLGQSSGGNFTGYNFPVTL